MRVFSMQKYREEATNRGKSIGDIMFSVMTWGKYCEGMTENEMLADGYSTSGDWMEDVDDNLVFSTLAWFTDMARSSITIDPQDLAGGYGWVYKCDGLSMAEMREAGYAFVLDWMVPYKEWEKLPSTQTADRVGGIN